MKVGGDFSGRPKLPPNIVEYVPEDKETYEFVKHPSHYMLPNGIECKDVIVHFPVWIAFAMKHMWRAGKKPGEEEIKDLKKATQEIQFRIDELEEAMKEKA